MKTPHSSHRHTGMWLVLLALAVFAPGEVRADYANTILGDSPLGFWPLNLAVDTSGYATDFSGNGNNGTYINIYPANNAVAGPSAYITNGVSFDGSTTYVDLSTGTNTGILDFGGLISLEAWVQPGSPTSGGYIIGKGYDASQNADEIEMRLNNGNFHGGTYNSTTGNEGATGGSQSANWTHLVSTFDGTNWNLYQNGVLVDTSPDTVGAINFVDPWAIGDGTEDGGNRILNGNLCEVALYTYTLSPGQVAGHFLAGEYGTNNLPPIVTQQPVSQISAVGANVSFGVGVLSSSPVTYSWMKNGSPIGQTNATLSLNSVGPGSAGTYYARVSNTAGSTNTVSVALTVGIYSFAPITLASGSYNEDMIVEKQALVAATTATLDGGTNNTGTTWFEQGYYANDTTVGLPLHGSTFVSPFQGNHSYTMAFSYTTNDAVLINSSVPGATLTLTTPTAFAGLSVLGNSGGGAMVINYTVHHADNTTESGNFTLPDWFGGGAAEALGVGGRVDAGTRSFGYWGAGSLPYLYAMDFDLSDTNSTVTRIDFDWSSGTGNACLLAVSGLTNGNYVPMPVTGYNEDMIVEASSQEWVGGSYTTASVDNGTANTGNSWYEEGFSTTPYWAPGTGVPNAGSTFTSQSLPDHHFTMAPTFVGNDVGYVDSSTACTLTLANPTNFYSLSFLTGAGHGPVKVNYTVHHQSGSPETGTFSAPDWFAGAAPAWVVNGRLDVGSCSFQTWAGGNTVAIYSEDVTLTNTTSPVTSIGLSFGSGNYGGANAAVFALSGISNGSLITNLVNNISHVVRNANGTLSLTATGLTGYSYVVQFTTNLTPPVVWQNLGTNVAGVNGSWQFTDTHATNAARFYRTSFAP